MESSDLSSLRIDKTAPTFSPRRRRRWGWAITALLVALASVLGARWYRTRPLIVTTATVSQVYPSQPLTVLNASGYVVAQRKAAVASKMTGRLVWLDVEEGSLVRRGQVLARLESEDVAAARAQASAGLEGARAGVEGGAAALEQARATLQQARASLEEAEAAGAEADRELRRQTELWDAGVAPQANLDAAATRARRARAATRGAAAGLEAARHAVSAAEAQVSSARAAAEASAAALRGAAANVEYTLLRAPFDAVVLTKNADLGDVVTPIGSAASAKAAVVTLADLGSLQVEADVSESNLARIRTGQPAEVQFDALPGQRFAAVLQVIVPTADRAKGTVMTKVRLLRQDPRVLPEMSAKVSFLERALGPDETAPRTGVAKAAVARRGGRDVVFVQREDRAVETPIVLGGPLGDLVEVRRGVSPGDKVVLDPPETLRNGGRVRAGEG